MGRKYFGTDGVRGTVGTAPITPDFVLHLGAAAGRVLVHALGRGNVRRDKRPQVLIGKDTRISGYMLESALEAGFAAAGVDVILCGPLPTPAVAYLTRALRLSAGVVISASHNPYPDNGIKFFARDGFKLPDDAEFAIEEAIATQLRDGMICTGADDIGRARRLDDAAGRYIEFCKSTFPNDLDLRGLRIVVDCSNGAAYQTAPAVFHELGAKVIAVANQPDGFNINDGCGATHPEYLQAMVREHKADIGIALDGDADRVLMADDTGRLYNGDELLYILAMERRARHAASCANQELTGVVGTLMTNLGVENALRGAGFEFARAKVGDRYVLEELQQREWLIGGEGSGHLICLDKHTTGDGTVSALQVLAAMRRSQRSLAELTADLSLYPQVLLNVKVKPGFDWKAQAGVVKTAGEVEATLGRRGRVLIRPSGTEPVVRVMVEADDEALAQSSAETIAGAMREAVAALG
ncbi:phosphoglucosamine mutase [Derxia gummosa]|uniref:Phosphoglucosamine mutase n=1 Tax=Derxia gummosa DSM 723 TaxID=1121388 RepID=A0A8B6X0X8_9BURK|nr:phosphoglucosamine mutase [Derxia gummosa]